MKKVPRLPWSDERFHTPWIWLYTCSVGSRSSCESRTIEPRSLRSRYSFVVSYARSTDCTVVKSRGECFTSEVNTNSKRDGPNFVMMYRACVLPRRRDLAFLMLIDRTGRR